MRRSLVRGDFFRDLRYLVMSSVIYYGGAMEFRRRREKVRYRVVVDLQRALGFFLPSVYRCVLPCLIDFLLPAFAVAMFVRRKDCLYAAIRDRPARRFK